MKDDQPSNDLTKAPNREYMRVLQEKILGVIMLAGLIAVLPLVVHICLRDYYKFGLGWQFVVHAMSYLIYVVFMVFRNRICYEVRTFFLLSLLLISAFVGAASMGVFSLAPVTICACIVIAGILIGHRFALGLLVMTLFTYGLIAFSYVSDFQQYAFPLETYATSANGWMGWMMSILVYSVITVICLACVNQYIKEKTLENEAFRQKILQKNQELEKQSESLNDAKTQLEKANRVKDEFLGLMSHELRTPVNPIVGMTELLEKSMGDDPLNRDRVKLIRSSAERLLHSIDHILDVTTMDSGSVVVSADWSSIASLFKKISKRHEQDASDKGLGFAMFLDVQDCNEYCFDFEKVEELLGQLISNAIRFSESGNISVDFSGIEIDEGKQWELKFTVRDEGIGMESSKIAYVQEVFTQVDAGQNRKFEGLGLGLAIVARLIVILDGNIEFSSVLGEGTSVEFSILAPGRLCEKKEGPSAEIRGFKKPLRVLVAEDDAVNQSLARQLLESLGATVSIVGNGEDAMLQCQNAEFDLILMDVSMPVIDGIEATHGIRKIEGLASIPIVGLTAYNTESVRTQCKQAGMNDMILKPLSCDKILKVSEQLFGF